MLLLLSPKRRGSIAVLTVAVLAPLLGMGACSSSPPLPTPSPTGGAANFAEPVKLTSKDGVLEVRLRAHQGTATLDTVNTPVQNFMLFGYEVITGSASNNQMTADNLYPGPTLNVSPGETLIVHLANELSGLTIPDFFNPAFTPAGQPVPRYPEQLTSAPFNMHTHGLHVSPQGNSDNVLLDIPADQTNTYTYRIPSDHPQGLYWYHSHRHQLTAAETYEGLSGLLIIGRADGNIPSVTQNNIPIRTMAIQYNYVFDRKGGRSQLNNPNWPQYVSTLNPPLASQLADGSYVPNLAPVNFAQSAKGTTFFTNWWAGPLAVANDRGQFQFMPSNLQSFSNQNGQPTGTDVVAPMGTTAGASAGTNPNTPPPSVNIAVDAAMPDAQRDVQFTINGQFQPVLKSKPGQTEIWVLANVSDFAYVNLSLTETATGNHPTFAVVGQDGNPYTTVANPITDGGTTMLVPPATRFAIAVTMPARGDLVLEMAQSKTNTQPMTNEGVLYTNNGTDKPTAVLGTVSVPPASVSYVDGFFAFPTQVLARVQPAEGQGTTTPFVASQSVGASTSFVDTQTTTPAVDRTLVITGGFGNENASADDPKAFVYQFDDNAFPNIALIQPRLNSVEQWTFENRNNDEHPIHIHVNDFQVAKIVDPTGSTSTGFQMWGQDNLNVPAPQMDAAGNVTKVGSITLRTKFLDYTGTYVVHCHRLNHEDNGLMAIINVIPEISSYAVAVPGSPGTPATVKVLDGSGDKPLATVTPFATYEGAPNVVMADVNGDQILDLVVAQGEGGSPEIVAYSGAAAKDGAPFTTELTRFMAFDADYRGGVHLAASNIEGGDAANNIVVGSGNGIEAEVKVFAAKLPEPGQSPELFSSWKPYPGLTNGVTVAAGMVDATSGRNSIVTAPGPGSAAQVKVWRFSLYEPNTVVRSPDTAGTAPSSTAGGSARVDGIPRSGTPDEVTEFTAFDASYTGGVSLAVGWVAGAEGGAQSIAVGQLAAPGAVQVFSAGSRLNGQPLLYIESPVGHGDHETFAVSGSFIPFADSRSGVRLAVTSTTYGADLLVSGVDPAGSRIQRFELRRSAPKATTLAPNPVGDPMPTPGEIAVDIGGR